FGWSQTKSIPACGGSWSRLARSPIWSTNPGTGCDLASSRIHGLDSDLGSLSGCRSDRSKSWPKALCPKIAWRESDAGWKIGLRTVAPHGQGGCHIDCGATDATASSVDLALR